MGLRLPPAWLMVAFGLILNILAIMVSSLILEQQSQQITELLENKESNRYSIELAWNQVETLERKRESLLLHQHLSAMSNNDQTAFVAKELKRQLSDWLVTDLTEVDIYNPQQIVDIINQAQQQQRDIIDELYLANLTLSDTMARIEGQMKSYKNLALFLQIFGLALIVARDLSRR